jgi:hypothetical protein
MTFQARHARTRQREQENAWDRGPARLLALLEDHPDDALTIAAMRTQVMYALQPAGHDIDRAPAPGHPYGPLGYRLRSYIPHVDGRADDAGAVDER